MENLQEMEGTASFSPFGSGLLNNQAVAFRRWDGLSPFQGTAFSVPGGAPWEPGWLRRGDVLKRGVHSGDSHLDQMNFTVFPSTWGSVILFLYAPKLGMCHIV